ncbi:MULTISPECIES: hypothetical protein [unclassified Sphingobium]|uniref:hypothetical protein n=1 Tax=unclassified Sphingobium TaxID=2611147 RepID=UPI000770343F|nr:MULTISPECIES: hypothetical protein [unclassified Sphingobium]AMK24023.1 hypothetical protein K426_15455 [Sphingobium sp. TKS]NML89203.1 hypothetical protein [Sphingobium sp. TB-6]
MKTLITLVLAYALTMAIGFLLYIGLIRSPLLSDVGILFYRGIIIAGLAALLMLIAGLLLRHRLRLDHPTLVGAIALSLSFNICFLITFPVTFDRSITMFLLARIERHDGALDTARLEQLYVREYLGDMRQIDRRVAEQTLSGNIRIDQGRIHITPQGRRLLAGGRMIGGWFGADPRFVTAPSPTPRH